MLTAIKNNLKAYSINDDNSESEIANFILDVSVNNNQLIIDLGDTSSGAFADYANAPIRLEYEDTSTTDDPLKGASGAVMSSFEFSVYADEYYSEVVRTGATTINATLDEGAEIRGNELLLSFEGGTLHAQDILYNDLENELKIIDTTDDSEVADAIQSIESISGSEIRIVLDHEAITKAENDGGQGVAYGRVLAVEYDGSTNVLRSIDRSLPSFSDVRFTYDPTLGFDRGSSGADSTSKAVELVFSGGLLDVPAAETDLTTLKTKVGSYLSVYKIDDQTGNTSVIANAISSVGISDGNGTDISQNSKVTVNLDMTVLQSAGIKHDDQLRIEYDPGSADDGLKSAAVTLDGTGISSETIGRFDTTFDVDMAHMPEISTATYDGEDLKLTFTGGDLKLAAEADGQAALFTSIKSKLKIATESGFTNDSVIADAITSIKAMTDNSITLELDPDKLSEYVEQGESLFIEYDANGAEGILQAAGTGDPELGRFERGFSVELGSEFDELYVGVAGELSLDFEDTPLKLLNADDATEAQQTAKKVAIKNAFTISTEEDGEGTVLTGAVTGVKSLSATELKLEINQTILSEKGVEPGDQLYLNYSGAANVLEGNNDIDVLSFSQEFDANLSDLANFEISSYQGNEFHLTFTDQSPAGSRAR